jgi:hypothetical protein
VYVFLFCLAANTFSENVPTNRLWEWAMGSNDVNPPQGRAIQSRATQAEKTQLHTDIQGILAIIRPQLARCTRPAQHGQ